MSGRRGDFKSKLIKSKLKEEPFCEVCHIFPSQEIHHIIPLCDGGTDSEDNAAALCRFCHRCVPGNYPDGYVDEFEIYKLAGGILMHFFRMGYSLAAARYIKKGTDDDFIKSIRDCRTERQKYQKYFRQNIKARGPEGIHIMSY